MTLGNIYANRYDRTQLQKMYDSLFPGTIIGWFPSQSKHNEKFVSNSVAPRSHFIICSSKRNMANIDSAQRRYIDR